MLSMSISGWTIRTPEAVVLLVAVGVECINAAANSVSPARQQVSTHTCCASALARADAMRCSGLCS